MGTTVKFGSWRDVLDVLQGRVAAEDTEAAGDMRRAAQEALRDGFETRERAEAELAALAPVCSPGWPSGEDYVACIRRILGRGEEG